MRWRLMFGACALAASGAASAHDHETLGTVHFPVSCSPEAQQAFEHGLALLHHMTYPQARESFLQVATLDPKCAMAHWGVAMTLFQPLWPTRPGPEARQRGWDELQTAEKLAPPTDRERQYVATAEAFFSEPASEDYWLRIRRWEQASEKLYRALPDDEDAAAFYALAHLAVVPPNVISRTNADESAAILLGIYQKNPDHPGAMHYLVHANDVPGREHEELEITNKYESAAPDNPHALHMPTHIYTRLGDWDGVIRGNLLAANAALKTPAGEHGELVWDEFPHAIEYLVYAYLQKGDYDDARGAARSPLGHATPGAQLQDGVSPRVHARPLRTRAAGLEGSGGHPGARPGEPRLGQVSLGRGDIPLRARTRRRPPRPDRRSARRKSAACGAGCQREQGGRRAVRAKHPRAAPRGGCMDRAGGRKGGCERLAHAGSRGPRDEHAEAPRDAGAHPAGL